MGDKKEQTSKDINPESQTVIKETESETVQKKEKMSKSKKEKNVRGKKEIDTEVNSENETKEKTQKKKKSVKPKTEKVPEAKIEKKPGKGKKVLIVLVAFVLLIAMAIFLFLKIKAKKTEQNIQQNLTELASSTEGSVTAYGVINIGSTEETLDIENMTSTLDIEEIMFASGDSITAGDALIRFSEESVAEALSELSKNLREKELSYRSGEIEYEQSLITAQYTYDSTILKGQQADAVYNETVANLKDSLQSATDTYTDAKEQLAEYKNAQANNTYYTDYQVEYYKSVYDENLAILQKKVDEWGVAWEEITRGGARLGADTHSQYVYVLSQMYSILETNLRDYENALEQYENAQADLSYNLLSLQLDMSSIEESYLNAKKTYETGLLTAEETRQTSKTNAELAESTYEATVEKAKTDFDSLKSAYEDAQADYDTFVARIVDNQYIAENTGTVMRSNVRNNGTVGAGTRIAMYSDLTDVTVSVSVDQSDIAKLAVGDTAVCYASSTGLLSGTIKSISPVTQSTSISSVTYSVTVKIDSDENSDISSNTTVTVLFGVDMAAASGMNLSSSQGTSENGGMPDMSGFDFSNMPDMSNFGGGSMPNFGGGNPFGN